MHTSLDPLDQPSPPLRPLLLAAEGSTWPRSLQTLGPCHPLNADSLELATSSGSQPLWIGYHHPLDLLLNPELEEPTFTLESWCQDARLLLELRQASPERCLLLNLSRLSASACSELCHRAGSKPATALSPPPEEGSQPAPTAGPGPLLDPRLALLALQHPDLQNLYADLEGCVELFGREPEFQLGLPALRSDAFAEQCLASWSQQRADCQQLKEAREEAELTLLQLHQVQEELEQVFLEHRKASQELKQARSEIDQLGEQLGKQSLDNQALAGQLKEAREEAELTLLQLHQVQEEMEHYFLEHRKASQELEQQRSEQEELEHEARLLFVHSTPKPGLNRSHLNRIHQLIRETLELEKP